MTETLLRLGVDTVFGITGGAIIPFYDALFDYKGKIRNIMMRHEQGAAHAAEGYARVTGKPGVCAATSGPGACNLITGIADAYMDSVPLLAIGGQVPTYLIGNDAFQETDLMGLTVPITKHNFQIRDTSKVAETLMKAYKIAVSGRPGPVYVDVPKDIQIHSTNNPIPKEVVIPSYKPNIIPNPRQLKKAAELIMEAERPLIISGGGVVIANASTEVKMLAEIVNCPITTTTMGKGAFPENHPLSLGVLGMHGQEHANYAVINSDLLIAIGCRFSDRVTGDTKSFEEGKKIIHIDIDPAEIGKNVNATIPVVGDAKPSILGLIKCIDVLSKKMKFKHSEWNKRIKEMKELCESHTMRDVKAGGLTQAYCVSTISRLIEDNDVVTTGVGQHQMFGEHYLARNKPRTWLTSGGAGTMGYGLPCAIGAKVGLESIGKSEGISGAQVIDIDGDGSFQMSTQELAVCKEENIKVTPVIMNNSYLGMVRQWLETFSNKRYSGVYFSKNPDFVKMAECYHLSGIKVTRKSEFEEAFLNAYKSEETVLVDVHVEKEEGIWPMLPPASSLKEIIMGKTIFKQTWDDIKKQRAARK